MGLETLSFTPSYSSFPSNLGHVRSNSNYRLDKHLKFLFSAKVAKEESYKNKKSLFRSVTEALDFAQVRSAEDAREVCWRKDERGTVNGAYVEDGWVDKTCKACKKGSKGEARQVDKFGRYVHVACLDKSKLGSFFTRLFST